MDLYSKKIKEIFKGKVVRKDLTALMKRGANVPCYVLEYLLGMYCSTDDKDTLKTGIDKITQILSSNYVRKDEIEKIKYILKEQGSYTIIDKISGIVDEENNIYLGTFLNFSIGQFIIPEEFAKENPNLFTGGMWCMIKLKYTNGEKEVDISTVSRKKVIINNAYEIVGLRPIQVPNINIDYIKECRKQFTLDEWIVLMLRSVGIEATEFNDKEKYHLIERLVPLFERNYNLVELGPRGTGKTHIYKEISPYSFLASGGNSTISNLFFNLRSRTLGLVCVQDCVAFDEVSKFGFKDETGIQMMKDYMAS